MPSSRLLNYLLLIRLIIYAFIFLIITVFNIFFDGPTQKEFLLNLMLSVSFFSIFSFIASKSFNQKFIFYMQPVFDIIVIVFLILQTGFIASPFMIFFAIIIFYMSFFEGRKGGAFGLLLILFVFTILFIIYYEKFHLNITNKSTYYLIVEYLIIFIIIFILSVYLHLSYKQKSTEKEFLENRLRILKNLHENILETINIGIILLNESNTILSCNKAAKTIIKKDENEIVGYKLDKLFGNFEKKENILFFNKKYIGYKYQDFLINDKDILGKLFIFQDVTEKEILKNKLEKQQKLVTLGQFSSVIAHEIKNPLGAIKGSFQLIKKDIKQDNKLVNIIDREIHRLDLVLNNLLYVSKPAFKEEIKISLNDSIKEFLSSIKYYNVFEEIKYSFNYDDNYKVYLSNYELKQILWNLFLNTYEIKNDAKVNIIILKKNNRILLEYMDNGKGIEPEILKEVIQPFFTTKKTGTGLGLYVIETICKKYDINYKIYANNEVKGFKIDFELKIAEV